MTVEIFLTGAPNFELPPKENYLGNCIKIEFEGVDIDLQKAMQVQKISCDYQMTNQSFLTGPARWNNTMNLNPSELEHFFKLVNRICRENKLKEFQFKFLDRIIAIRGNNYVALVLNKIVTFCQFSKALLRRVRLF